MKKYFVIIAILLIILAGLIYLNAARANEPAPSSQPTSQEPSPPAMQDQALEKLDALSLEQRVGQMFFIRCPETMEETQTVLKEYVPGGLLLFARDFENETPASIREKIEAYQAASKLPLLVGVDEEGGTVVRVSKYPQFRDQPFPSPQSLYNEGGIKEVLATELEKAALLKDLGINVNFAPVADVSTDPSDFINARSLGKPAPETARCIGSVVNAMKGEGMGTVLKHFPGYGTNRDTHTGVAIDERPFETFQESDFLPFQAGIEAGAGCILISHTIVKSMDDQNPASLSPAVHDILRQQLGFNGVAITDDLDMDAIADYAEEGEAAVAAVLAGNDMLITSDYARQIPQVVEAVRNGVIPGNLIDQAALRVLLWKMELGILQP